MTDKEIVEKQIGELHYNKKDIKEMSKEEIENLCLTVSMYLVRFPKTIELEQLDNEGIPIKTMKYIREDLK